MGIQTVLGHDHDLQRVERREWRESGGYTIVEECRDDACDYWRATGHPVTQQTL